MVRLGRYRNANTRKRGRGDTTVFESEDFKQQVFQNSKKTYVQEIAVDSLRCNLNKLKLIALTSSLLSQGYTRYQSKVNTCCLGCRAT